jgi:hypothetical protein
MGGAKGASHRRADARTREVGSKPPALSVK